MRKIGLRWLMVALLCAGCSSEGSAATAAQLRSKFGGVLKQIQGKDYKQAHAALQKVSKQGPGAIFAILHGTLSPHQKIRKLAAMLIHRYRHKNFKDLMAALLDKDPRLRNSAMEILWHTPKATRVGIPILIQVLDDPHFKMKAFAAAMLGRFGTASSGALKKLFRNLREPQPMTKRMTAGALALILHAIGVFDPRLVKLLGHKDAEIRMGICLTVRFMARRGSYMLPYLLPRLQDPHRLVRMWAISAIGSFRASSSAAVPALIKAFKKERDVAIKSRLIAALAGIGEASAPAVPLLRKALKGPVVQLKTVAASAIGQIGPKAIAALPELLGVLKHRHRDRFLRLYATQALGKLGPKARKALPLLRRIQKKDPEPSVRRMAAASIKLLSAKKAPKR